MRAKLEMLDAPLLERILDEAMEILETIGVMVEDPTSAERLVEVGFRVRQGPWLVIPRQLVEQAIKSAPSSFTLFNRDGEPHARLGGDEVHFAPASSALHILDFESQKVRDPVTSDFIEYVKVADQLKNLSYLSTAFIPTDVPQDIADAWRLYLVLSYSQQPVVSGTFTGWGVKRMGEIMSHFRRDRDDLRNRPLAIFTCCPNTPLRWEEDSIRNLIDCAEWGIPVEVVPALLLGMISPVTPIGALVLHTAEVLSGLTVAQCVRPGTPVLFGGAPAAFHMRNTTNPMSAVEALRVCCGYAQIAKHLKLPCQAYMGLSDSKFNDIQAGAETGVGTFLAVLAGINSVSGPGMLDYVNCFSLEKLIFDDEIVAQAHRFVREIEIKADLPTRQLIEELIEENQLLTSQHTLEHWSQELYLPGPMVDRTNWEQWKLEGSKRFPERAREQIEDALASYNVKPIDNRLHREIRNMFTSTCKEQDIVLPELEE